MSSSSSFPPQVSFAAQTVQFLNATAASLIPSWISTVLRVLLLAAALPLFTFGLAVYMVYAVHAWEEQSCGKISEVPIRYNRVRWGSLPVLPRIEAVLTWDWYTRPVGRRGK